jgi:hypothetical protein
MKRSHYTILLLERDECTIHNTNSMLHILIFDKRPGNNNTIIGASLALSCRLKPSQFPLKPGVSYQPITPAVSQSCPYFCAPSPGWPLIWLPTLPVAPVTVSPAAFAVSPRPLETPLTVSPRPFPMPSTVVPTVGKVSRARILSACRMRCRYVPVFVTPPTALPVVLTTPPATLPGQMPLVEGIHKQATRGLLLICKHTKARCKAAEDALFC